MKNLSTWLDLLVLPLPFITNQKVIQKAMSGTSFTVSGYRVPQIREKGLSAIHQVCEQTDNAADSVSCEALQ